MAGSPRGWCWSRGPGPEKIWAKIWLQKRGSPGRGPRMAGHSLWGNAPAPSPSKSVRVRVGVSSRCVAFRPCQRSQPPARTLFAASAVSLRWACWLCWCRLLLLACVLPRTLSQACPCPTPFGYDVDMSYPLQGTRIPTRGLARQLDRGFRFCSCVGRWVTNVTWWTRVGVLPHLYHRKNPLGHPLG